MSRDVTGQVVWITGLSGAGKSTLAREFVARLRQQGHSVVLLDGDELREVFGAVTANSKNHGREGRSVVIATISLFREVHAWNRAHLPRYFEVYLKVPVQELRRRDPKGIYRRFDAGELHNVAGLDLSIDEPDAADWLVPFEPERCVEILADNLLDQFYKRNWI